LAWGAIELIVGFAPTQSKFKLSLTKGSPYLLLVKGIHDLAYPEEEKVSPAADNVKVTIAAWKAGHPAWLFCDDATLKRENARVAEIQKERRVQPNGPRRAGVAAATKH